MRKQWVVPSVVLLALFLGPFTPQYAQNAPARSGQAENARHSLAVNLLRAINTAEMNYRRGHGTYVSWDTLVADEEFTNRGIKWAVQNDPQLANLHFSNGPDILPGWRLRLNLTPDGKGYDLLLEDTTDKECGYAAFTDERGLIRQSKVIDCQI